MFVGVRSYLDRSGQSAAAFITLAAFAASDFTWAQFEAGWDATLKTGFRPVPYFHMKEALGLGYKTPFSYSLGWKREHVWDLVFKLISYIAGFPRGDLTMHSCVIDMNAWRELVAGGCDIPSETALCNRYVSHYIVAMYARKVLEHNADKSHFYMRTEDLLNFSFDRSEDFYEPFRLFVNKEKQRSVIRGECAMWDLVDGVGEADMRDTPGIQAADILAWGTNRENTAAEGADGAHLAHILRQLVASTSKEYNRDALVNEFGTGGKLVLS
jgi:hypothetical protein